ncbi:MAG: YkvA family protein [Rhizonema sp. PD38]|nr:YkvA family protein [Rhizonema sp. PD38]
MFKPIKLVYSLYRNALRNSKYRWWIIGGTFLWLVNPINTIPVVGEVDDAIVLTILATEMSQIVLESVKNNKQQKDSILTTQVTQEVFKAIP